MLDPRLLYTLEPDAPALDHPVLIHALDGFVDAGEAVRLTHEHLLGTLEHHVVGRFDVDQLHDYRARRPAMIFDADHWESYAAPELLLYSVKDAAGGQFLLLTGPEPDVQWERYIAAVIELIDHFGVRLTIGLNAIPMAVPHTRPTGITAHASKRELISGYEPWLQRVQVPGSAGHLLEYRLGQQGHDAMGFAVHVPHYLAQTDYPDAAAQLLGSLSRTTGLLLPTEELRTSAATIRAEVDRQIADNPDAAELVTSLEEQYDAYLRGRTGGGNLLTNSGPLPTAEELGAELERFLANQITPPGDQPGQ